MAFDVVVALQPVDPHELGGVRLPGLAHEVQQRQRDRHDHPDDRAENRHGEQCGHAEHELAAPDRGESHERADGEDAERGSDHDRRQHRLGQVAERLRCTNDESKQHRRGDDTGQLRTRPSRLGDRGAGLATTHRHALEQASRNVDQTERDEFLVGVHALAALVGVHPRQHARVGESDECDAECTTAERANGLPTHLGQSRAREPRRKITDEVHAVLSQPENHGRDRAADHRHERARNSRHEPAEADDHHQCRSGKTERPAVRLTVGDAVRKAA